MKKFLAAAASLAALCLLVACGSVPIASHVGNPPSASPTATPAPAPPTPDKLITKLKAAGLPIGQVQDYTAATDPNHLLGRPSQYIAKVNFEDTRLQPANFDVSDGGSIEGFATVANLDTRAKYMATLAQSPMFAEYDYSSASGLFLLRLSSTLTPTQAQQYVAALKGSYPDLAAVTAS
jgi:hypothetical protein